MEEARDDINWTSLGAGNACRGALGNSKISLIDSRAGRCGRLSSGAWVIIIIICSFRLIFGDVHSAERPRTKRKVYRRISLLWPGTSNWQ